jgi:thiol-disulfide isomerase/thioredoxin
MMPRTLFASALAATALAAAHAAAAAPAPLDLSAYRGKVVYLDFWASWCAPCRLSFPWLADLQSTYGDKGLVVLAVNVDHDRAAADRFLQTNFSDFKVVFDPKGQIASTYKIRGMPSSVLIGRDGRVRFSHVGFFQEKEGDYASQINQLLAEKAP